MPISVGVTEDVAGRAGPVHQRPGDRDARRARSPAATTRCAGCRSASTSRCAGCSRRSARPSTRCPTTPSPARGPAVLDLPDGDTSRRRHLVGGVLRRACRDGVREGAGVVLNPTNGASYSGTIVQTQQIASSRLRALETGPLGGAGGAHRVLGVRHARRRRASSARPSSERAVIRRAVELRSGETWYTRLGDWPVIAVLPWLGRRAAGWRRRSPALVAASRRQRSRSTVTGPSLTSDTRIVGAEPPGRHGGAERAQRARRRARRAARPAPDGPRRSSSAGGPPDVSP